MESAPRAERRSRPDGLPARAAPERPERDQSADRRPVAGRPRSPGDLLRLQRLAGNRAVASLHRSATAAAPAAAPATVTVTVQRDAGAAAPVEEPWFEAVNLVNKNSMFKVSFSARPSIPGGMVEIKKVAVNIDGITEISAPWISPPKAPGKLAGGVDQTAKSEGARTTAARVYAAELRAQIPELMNTRLRDLVTFKVAGEVDPGREAVASAGFLVDAELFALEQKLNLLAVDLTAKDPRDRFKPLSAKLEVRTGKFLEHRFPGLLGSRGRRFDLKVRFRVGGSFEVGPRWEALEPVIAKRYGAKWLDFFRHMVLNELAREESDLAIRTLSDQLAREATDGISDTALREYALMEARERALAEAEKLAVQGGLVQTAESAAAGAAAKADVAALRAVMRKAAEAGARDAFAAVGRSVIREAVKDAVRLSFRRVGATIGAALALGPVDVILIGLDMLGSALGDIIRTQEIEDVGMTAQVMRDNYAQGYRDGLAGKGTGAAQPSGRGSPEGLAYAGGLGDGASQFGQTLDAALAGRAEVASGLISRDDVVKQVKELMVTLPVDTGQIVGRAGPKLEKFLVDAWVEAHTGVLDRLLGTDVRDSRSFADLLRNVRSNLAAGATHTEFAHLANGVRVRVVALDRLDVNARRFRTADGGYLVNPFGGQTKRLSGWVTEAGQPLEELYGDQAAADTANAGGPAFEQRMADMLGRSSLRIHARFGASGMRGESLTVRGPGGSSIEFTQYMRTAPALARTVGSFAAVVVAGSYLPAGGTPGSLTIHKRGGTILGGDRGGQDNANLARFARDLGLPTDGSDLAHTVARHLYDRQVAGARLSSFPTPTLLPD